MIVQGRGQVYHHVVMGSPQMIDDLPQVWRGDQIGSFGGRRRQQNADAGRVIDHHRVDDVAIRLASLDRVDDRAILGVQVEQDAATEKTTGITIDRLVSQYGLAIPNIIKQLAPK